jgi:PAS domain S-box-containing protein
MGAPDRESLMTNLSGTLFVSADDQERFWNLLVRDGVVRGFESAIQRLDGTGLRVRTTARIFAGPEGEVLYVEGTVEDITNELRVQELSGSEARFRTVFQDSQSGIAILDLSGLIREVNPAFNRFFGHKGRDMVGTAFPDLLTEEDRPAAIREIEALAGGNQEQVRAQRRFMTPSGKEEWAGSSLSLIRRAGGEPEDILAILTSLPPG